MTRGQLFLFQFPNSNSLQWVLESGPWHGDHKPLLFQEWSPDLSLEKLNLKRIPAWIILRNIPLQFTHKIGISYIASVIGKPLYMDNSTASQLHSGYAKVCIEMVFDDDLMDVAQLDIADNFWVDIIVDYPWFPDKCEKCKVFGLDCTKKKIAQRKMDVERSEQQITKELEQIVYDSPKQNSVEQSLAWLLLNNVVLILCAPEFRLVGARMRSPKCNAAWECPPSGGRATDAREKESPLPVYDPKVEGR
ncbi:hypothetical protein CRG98_020167 [Punica granatum]|uniref:DUF4283 domain-containing protein n=1 Tax=Punica granatum TaxID=22663 RepID=A0A2I0JSY3_PUNGR|nr:hypothetical protein CRG98_020167 [Punica granatum]